MSRGTFVERNQTRERLYTIHVTARMIESYCNRYTYSYVYKFYMSSNTRSLYMHIEMQFQSILNLQVMFWYILELVLSLLNLPNFHEYTHSVSRHSSGMRWIVQSLFNIVYIIYLYHCVDVLSHYSNDVMQYEACWNMQGSEIHRHAAPASHSHFFARSRSVLRSPQHARITVQ